MKRKISIAIASAVMGIAATAALGSSHREAPFVTKYPQTDATDFYLFNSYEPGREGYVTMIANYVPVQAAYGGPHYFPLDSQARYEIHVDNDGDSVEDITFRFRFKDSLPNGESLKLNVGGEEISSVLRNIATIDANSAPGLNHLESYTVERIDGVARHRSKGPRATHANTGEDRFAKPFDYSGTKTFGGPGNYTDYADGFVHPINLPGCSLPGRVFVGQRHEAFKISLGEVFDLVNFVPIEGDSAPGAGDGDGFPMGITQSEDRNILARNNVTSIALEVHSSCLTSSGESVVGAWTSASLRQINIFNPRPTFEKPEISGGRFVQVSRLSAPLVNELFIGFDRKDRFNASQPKDDRQFLTFVTNPGLPAILDSLFRGPVNSILEGTPDFVPFDNLAPSNFPRQDLVTAFLTGFPGVNQFAHVAPGEMLRLNTEFEATPRDLQQPLGLAAGDFAGFPNGRRPGDDVVDIALRVAMGALCHDLPLGMNGDPVNLGLCTPGDAPTGQVAFTDGAPLTARDLNNSFPYLLTPYPGSPVDAPLPQPTN